MGYFYNKHTNELVHVKPNGDGHTLYIMSAGEGTDPVIEAKTEPIESTKLRGGARSRKNPQKT